MANAIKKISVQRGYDVTEYALNCFGGAGGQHACAVADALGMGTVQIHPLSGILSAYGMGLAQVRANRSRALIQELVPELESTLEEVESELQQEAESELQDQDITHSEITSFTRVHIRYDGTDLPLPVPLADTKTMIETFETSHRKQFGFVFENKQLIVEAVEVESVGGGADISEPKATLVEAMAKPDQQTKFFSNGAWHNAGIHQRKSLNPGSKVQGPALIIEPHQTLIVEPGWQAQINALGHVILTRSEALARQAAIGTDADPVMLEVFNNLFMSIAEQMGVTLQTPPTRST